MPEFCRTCNHWNIHCLQWCNILTHWWTPLPFATLIYNLFSMFEAFYRFLGSLFFKFCILMMHGAQDGARGSVEALHQKSERWMWFSLVQELWVQLLLRSIILPGLNKLPITACQCQYLNMCQHCKNTPFFWSRPILFAWNFVYAKAY